MNNLQIKNVECRIENYLTNSKLNETVRKYRISYIHQLVGNNYKFKINSFNSLNSLLKKVLCALRDLCVLCGLLKKFVKVRCSSLLILNSKFKIQN